MAITTGHNNEAAARCFSTPAAQVPSLNAVTEPTHTMYYNHTQAHTTLPTCKYFTSGWELGLPRQ